MSSRTRGPPNLAGNYVESSKAQQLAISKLRHLLHISAVCT